MLQASLGCPCLSLLSAEITDTCHLAQLSGEIFRAPLLALATEVECIARLVAVFIPILLLCLHLLVISHSHRDVED